MSTLTEKSVKLERPSNMRYCTGPSPTSTVDSQLRLREGRQDLLRVRGAQPGVDSV